MTLCGAEWTSFERALVCELATPHRGRHRSGVLSWPQVHVPLDGDPLAGPPSFPARSRFGHRDEESKSIVSRRRVRSRR